MSRIRCITLGQPASVCGTAASNAGEYDEQPSRTVAWRTGRLYHQISFAKSSDRIDSGHRGNFNLETCIELSRRLGQTLLIQDIFE